MNCDAVAPFYHLGEFLAFGGALQQRRTAFLDKVSTSRRALVLGDGDGRFLAALLCTNPLVEVVCVDSSAAMLAIAESRVSRLGSSCRNRVRFHRADARHFAPAKPHFDLIASHFFLDCLPEEEIAQLIERISHWMSSNAVWLLSEFRQADRLLPRLWTRAVIRGLYVLFRVTTGLRVTRLPDYSRALAVNGLERQILQSVWQGLLVSELWRKRT
jgi:SAM-dependent methyltransferase